MRLQCKTQGRSTFAEMIRAGVTGETSANGRKSKYIRTGYRAEAASILERKVSTRTRIS